MKTVEFGEGSVIGEISHAAFLADKVGRYFNKVVLTEAEYAQVRKELALPVDSYHPTTLPVYGGRSVFYMVQAEEGEAYNPGLRQQENELREQMEMMCGVVPGAGGTDDEDEFDEHLIDVIENRAEQLVGTETGLPAPGSDSKQ